MIRIELTYAAWKAAVLPLNYTRICNRSGVSEGNRTLDPLIKSQLLYHLSYRDISGIYKAGAARFELTNEGVKVPCLTAWLRPNQIVFAPSGASILRKKMVETGGFEPPNP